MFEEQIQYLIESIEIYDAADKPAFFILWYFDGYEFDIEDQYFAVMAVNQKPNKQLMENIRKEVKKEFGNIIYAADYLIYTKNDAIDHLESLID